MQAYGRVFARVYNLKWAGFAQRIAPKLLEYYARSAIGSVNRCVLDLCCGTGQIALYFLEHGCQVTGIDLSEHMLDYARENARAYLAGGQARFIQADASRLALAERFGLVVSTFDALNHLESVSPGALFPIGVQAAGMWRHFRVRSQYTRRIEEVERDPRGRWGRRHDRHARHL
jgi:SAM-dependent methyltransferase